MEYLRATYSTASPRDIIPIVNLTHSSGPGPAWHSRDGAMPGDGRARSDQREISSLSSARSKWQLLPQSPCVPSGHRRAACRAMGAWPGLCRAGLPPSPLIYGAGLSRDVWCW